MPQIEGGSELSNMGRINAPTKGNRCTFRSATLLLLVGVCVLVSGCKGGSEKIWSAESKSSDGLWLASASTIAQSGFGTGYIGTRVYLKPTNSSQPPLEIAEFSYEYEVPPGITSVEMKWLTPTHLEVSYKGHATVAFQAVKCAGIDISVRDVSNEAAKPMH
jgi:hypothetical protein